MANSIYGNENKKIAEKLKKARIDAGLDQVEVAKKLGKTQSYISKIESGQRRLDVLQLKDFAYIYTKSLNYFFE